MNRITKWEINEDSEYETWFWLFKFLRKYQVDYTVRATAKIAKLEYRPAGKKVEGAAGQNGDERSPVTVNVYNAKARTSAAPAAEASKGASASDVGEAEPESEASDEASTKKKKKKKASK